MTTTEEEISVNSDNGEPILKKIRLDGGTDDEIAKDSRSDSLHDTESNEVSSTKVIQNLL